MKGGRGRCNLYGVGIMMSFTPMRTLACLYYKNIAYVVHELSSRWNTALLPLVCDLDVLSAIQLHASRVLLGTDGTRLVLVLHKRNTSSSGYQTNFAEALEMTKDIGKSLDIAVVGEILNEQNLVRREVFVGYDGGGGRPSGFETGASCGFRRTPSLVAAWSGTLETLLLGFQGLLLIYERVKNKCLLAHWSHSIV